MTARSSGRVRSLVMRRPCSSGCSATLTLIRPLSPAAKARYRMEHSLATMATLSGIVLDAMTIDHTDVDDSHVIKCTSNQLFLGRVLAVLTVLPPPLWNRVS